MMRSPTAWPSASLYHLNPVMSTRPTAHQRPRCSSARNDSSCSVKRPKFISFVFGSRCDLSVRSATSCLEVAGDAADGRVLGATARVLTRGHLVGEAGRQRLNRFVLRFLPEALVPREDRVECREQICFQMSWQVQVRAHPLEQLVTVLRLSFSVRHFGCQHGSGEPSTNGVPDQPGAKPPAA